MFDQCPQWFLLKTNRPQASRSRMLPNYLTLKVSKFDMRSPTPRAWSAAVRKRVELRSNADFRIFHHWLEFLAAADTTTSRHQQNSYLFLPGQSPVFFSSKHDFDFSVVFIFNGSFTHSNFENRLSLYSDLDKGFACISPHIHSWPDGTLNISFGQSTWLWFIWEVLGEDFST